MEFKAVRKRSALTDFLAKAEFGPTMAELVCNLTTKARANDRLLAVRTAAYETAVSLLRGNGEEMEFQALAALFLAVEANGVGGREGLGLASGAGRSGARMKPFDKAGKGRFLATDGPVWQRAIEEAARQSERNREWVFTPKVFPIPAIEVGIYSSGEGEGPFSFPLSLLLEEISLEHLFAFAGGQMFRALFGPGDGWQEDYHLPDPESAGLRESAMWAKLCDQVYPIADQLAAERKAQPYQESLPEES